MLERKTLENVVKVSRLFDKRITGRMFFVRTDDLVHDKMFNMISICAEGVFLVHDEWGECQTCVEIEKVKSIYEVVDTRNKTVGKKLFNLSW